MNTFPAWLWDETVPVSTDFSDPAVVDAYDARHGQFRDIDGENKARVEKLQLQPGQCVADFGCGTGAFVIQAARLGAEVYAVDASPAMLQATQIKVRREGLERIHFRQGGFLTYEHDGPRLDAVTSSLALHHLPDFWKQRALNRMAGLLKPGGRFHLTDVVFPDEVDDRQIEAWVSKMSSLAGPEMAAAICSHIRKEYSTFAWILSGMLERAGFRIEETETADGMIARFTCVRL